MKASFFIYLMFSLAATSLGQNTGSNTFLKQFRVNNRVA